MVVVVVVTEILVVRLAVVMVVVLVVGVHTTVLLGDGTLLIVALCLGTAGSSLITVICVEKCVYVMCE